MSWLGAELVVIVVGILLAYQADSWRQDRVDEEASRQGLVRMAATLDSAATQDSLFVSRARERTKAATAFVEALRSGSLSPDSATALFGDLIFRRTYQPSSLAWFSGLRDGGVLGLISDDDLVAMLTDFHDGRLAYVDELMEMLDEIDTSLRIASLSHFAPVADDDGQFSWGLLTSVRGLESDDEFISTVAWAGYMTDFVANRVEATRAMNEQLRGAIRDHLR